VNEKAQRSPKECTLQLRITLRNTDPIIWRRVLVPGTMPLDQLHRVIQVVMGWEDRHLHVFEIRGKRYGVLDLEGEDEDLDETGLRLRLIMDERDRFTYEYDLGDGWLHDVEVETTEVTETEMLDPVCLDGARTCPPEDCGGAWRFAEFLKIMADPTHNEHETMTTWLGGVFDPEHFSVGAANARIQRLR